MPDEGEEVTTMARQVLADGRWFDDSKAQSWSEGKRWDGRNHISLATGSQWDHEILYRTRGGRWVLNAWSQWQGSEESYEEISDEQAAAWLVRNEHDAPISCVAQYAALEVE